VPSVNLRLTDEQHADLLEVARRENRSLQREIIYRLFGRFNQERLTPAGGREAKPDPKPGKRK
jgi:hypothetical protein